MPYDPRKIWFPAKTCGWGWGPPTCWQGWVVLAIWFILLTTGGIIILPRSAPLFLIYEAVLVSALIIVCYIKGEKPRWRWGKD
jgi:hypothetical protein